MATDARRKNWLKPDREIKLGRRFPKANRPTNIGADARFKRD